MRRLIALIVASVLPFACLGCEAGSRYIYNSVVPEEIKEDICESLPPGICKNKKENKHGDTTADTTITDTTSGD